jgi:undecaprenyl-diphosphatase
MNYWDAVILGIVEGLTEFLPISSTGHLMLASDLMGLPATEFLKSFEITIQLGAILSVVALYFKRLLVDFETVKKIIVAFIPTAILGVLLYKIVKTVFMDGTQIVLWALFLGGIFIVIFEKFHKEDKNAAQDLSAITYKQAFLIGVFQAFAMVPGVSRAGATIIGGLALGLGRKAIVEFSFLLAIPTMAAATGLDLLKNAGGFSPDQFGLLLTGFVGSFVIAILSIKFLLQFIKNHDFTGFGFYRIIAAAVFWFFIK